MILIGLVAFGGFADSKCPSDFGSRCPGRYRPRARNSQAGPRQSGAGDQCGGLKEELATAIGDGVSVAVDRLRGAKAKSKVIVLLTDGDNNAGVVDPREAAGIAAESGIRLYTIGIGRSGVVPIPQEDEFGNRVLVPAQFRIDEELLRDMAQTGQGGTFTPPIPRGWRRSMPRSTSLKNRSSRKRSTRNTRNCSAGSPRRGWRSFLSSVS